MRKAFIKQIWEKIDYCSKAKDKTDREKLELLAFSILVMIDGEDPNAGPFSLRPLDIEGKEGKDIAGNLHNRFYPLYKPNL